ncbi:hypothetical protein CYQ88_04550 [Hydrogenovibrio sp. SC-1]|uniref:HEPN domain-containing protein n=1 Tax=Hydrogenovibrio sp. SC-1 TaxID=2065820 RepID=UPI000C7E4249|nr:HEPN domain-containing protein [Hydrogenovibrio sp. SC-1]PLA74867.1 hypothetical protein CYQ88_04550 [Hydrogenovibrio sp. SC-1]
MSITNFRALKLKHKLIAEDATENFNVRIHRALKWLERSEKENGDHDAEFIFLWISFNAAYAQLFGYEHSEKENFNQFFTLIIEMDQKNHIHNLLFENFSGHIRTLIENKFIYEQFWRALRDQEISTQWKDSFELSKKKALSSLLEKDTLTTLSIVFSRLYVLRNQLIHGGSTWNSQVNRQQVMDGCKILRQLIPVVLALMVENFQEDYGELIYPLV